MASRRGIRVPIALWSLVVWAAVAAVLFASFAGWRLRRIESTSMAPTVPEGALAVIVPVSPHIVGAGEVISFRDPLDGDREVLHRVIRVVDRGAEGRFFETRGDANVTVDTPLVRFGDVTGDLRWHLPRVGSLAWALRPPVGLLVLGGLPLLILLASEIRGRRHAASSNASATPTPPSPCRPTNASSPT